MNEEVSGKFGKLQESAAFSTVFRRAFHHGVRPSVRRGEFPRAWDVKSFRDELARKLKERSSPFPGPSVQAIRGWIRSLSPALPRQSYIDAILDVLFGCDQDLQSDRRNLHNLWTWANAGKGKSDDCDYDREDHPDDRWSVRRPGADLESGLAAAWLFKPPSSRNDPNVFQLDATARFGLAPVEVKIEAEEPVAFKIGVRYAVLVPEYINCELTREQPDLPENVRCRVRQFEILGPLENGVLNGSALESLTIAELETTSSALPEVKIALKSRRLDLVVIADQGGSVISINRRRILETFLRNCSVSDEDSMITWSTSTLKREV
jgi:hypothetical protein